MGRHRAGRTATTPVKKTTVPTPTVEETGGPMTGPAPAAPVPNPGDPLPAGPLAAPVQAPPGPVTDPLGEASTGPFPGPLQVSGGPPPILPLTSSSTGQLPTGPMTGPAPRPSVDGGVLVARAGQARFAGRPRHRADHGAGARGPLDGRVRRPGSRGRRVDRSFHRSGSAVPG